MSGVLVVWRMAETIARPRVGDVPPATAIIAISSMMRDAKLEHGDGEFKLEELRQILVVDVSQERCALSSKASLI